MSGYIGDLNPDQQQSLEKIREIFRDALLPQHDDHMLLRFLRAKKFDLKKTEEMFRRHLEFRKKYPEEYYTDEYRPPKNISILRDLLLPPVLGYDKYGCPVRLVKAGKQDIKGLLCCVRPSEIKKYIIWFMDNENEELRKLSQKIGIYVEKHTAIIDLEGLNLMHIYRRDVYEMALISLQLYENHYPDSIKVAFILNTPSFFHYLFNMVKPFLSENTCEKIKIFGSNGWKDALLEYFDPDILPVIYGGTRTDADGDPSCPSLVRVLNPVPKELYLRNMNTLTEDDENVHKVIVSPRLKTHIHLKVDVPGSTVIWEVQCARYDIKSYLVYTEGARHEIVVKPLLVCSDFGSESGSYIAERKGKYSLVLDNSHSTFRSKEVMYKAYVIVCTSEKYSEVKTFLTENNNS